jgi:hypothetical protein
VGIGGQIGGSPGDRARRPGAYRALRAGRGRGQEGRYELVEQPGGGTEVRYELTVDLTIPMIGMFKRKAEKVITDTALKELKKRVEG